MFHWSQNFYMFVVVTVSYNQTRYQIDENKELVQVSLVFDNPSSADVIVTVVAEDRSAFGE